MKMAQTTLSAHCMYRDVCSGSTWYHSIPRPTSVRAVRVMIAQSHHCGMTGST